MVDYEPRLRTLPDANSRYLTRATTKTYCFPRICESPGNRAGVKDLYLKSQKPEADYATKLQNRSMAKTVAHSGDGVMTREPGGKSHA